MAITKGCQQLIAEARERIRTLSLAGTGQVRRSPGGLRHLPRHPGNWAGGRIPGAFFAPPACSGILGGTGEPVLQNFRVGQEFVLYCQSAAISLATAALQDMGLAPSPRSRGGFKAWRRPATRWPNGPPTNPTERPWRIPVADRSSLGGFPGQHCGHGSSLADLNGKKAGHIALGGPNGSPNISPRASCCPGTGCPP